MLSTLSTSSQSSENTPKTTSCTKLHELKLKEESEHTRPRPRTIPPTHRGPRAPHRRQVQMVVHRQQPAVVGPELRPLHVDELLGRQQVRVVQQLRRWCGEVKVRDFGGECWRLVIPSAAYRLLLRTPSPARPAGAQLLAKLRKHAENRLPPPPASSCASSSSRERASRRVRAHTSSTDPPRPSSTPPTTSSAGVVAATATCCRSRASSSPCRRSAAAAGRSAKSCSGSGVAR